MPLLAEAGADTAGTLCLVAGVLLGGLLGAVLPVPAYRLAVPYGAPARSTCAGCATPLPGGPRGWVRLPTRCPACGGRWGPPAWSTALAGALACGVPVGVVCPAAATDGRAVAAGLLVAAAFLLAGLAGVLLGAIDLACRRLPNEVVAPVFGLTLLLLGAATTVAGTGAAVHNLIRSLLAALLLSGAYLVLAVLPGANLGLGDVKLSGLLGLLLGWLGWPTVLLGALLPHLINGPVALVLLLARRAGRKTELPLGPALLVGALLAMALRL